MNGQKYFVDAVPSWTPTYWHKMTVPGTAIRMPVHDITQCRVNKQNLYTIIWFHVLNHPVSNRDYFRSISSTGRTVIFTMQILTTLVLYLHPFVLWLIALVLRSFSFYCAFNLFLLVKYSTGPNLIILLDFVSTILYYKSQNLYSYCF